MAWAMMRGASFRGQPLCDTPAKNTRPWQSLRLGGHIHPAVECLHPALFGKAPGPKSDDNGTESGRCEWYSTMARFCQAGRSARLETATPAVLRTPWCASVRGQSVSMRTT